MYHSYSTLFPQHFLPPFMAPLSRVFHTLIWSTTVYPHQFFPPSSPHPHAPIPPSTPHSQNNLSSSSHPHGTYSSLNCIPSWHIFLPQLHTLMTSISTSTLHPHGTYSSLNSTPSWHIFLPQLYTLMAPILPSTPHPHGTDSFHYSTPSSHLWSIPACCHLYANLSPLHQAGGWSRPGTSCTLSGEQYRYRRYRYKRYRYRRYRYKSYRCRRFTDTWDTSTQIQEI